MKKNFEKIFMYIGMIFVGLLIIGLTIILIPANYELEFYLNDEYLVEGDIYFNGEFMGSTDNGLIKISENKIGPGELTFVGLDKEGKEYSIYFDMYEEDYYGYYLPFTITEEDIISSQLDISKIDEDVLRENIFNLINIRRNEYGIKEVKRNHLLNGIAQEYAEKIMETDLFAHTPEEGYDLGKRIKEKQIFYSSASEVLSQVYFYGEDTFASYVVDGWISSPSHRSTILDADKPIIWENVGVGVSCKENVEGIICYSVGIFANLEMKISDELREDYYIAYEIYSEGYDFSFPVNIKIIFNSTKNMDLLLLETIKDYDRLLSRNSYNEIFEKERIKNFETEIEIKKGNVLVPHASVRDSDYNLTIIYNV